MLIESKYIYILITIYLVLSKAFDTLSHTILQDKLKFYYIRGCSLNLIENYLKIENKVLK